MQVIGMQFGAESAVKIDTKKYAKWFMSYYCGDRTCSCHKDTGNNRALLIPHKIGIIMGKRKR